MKKQKRNTAYTLLLAVMLAIFVMSALSAVPVQAKQSLVNLTEKQYLARVNKFINNKKWKNGIKWTNDSVKHPKSAPKVNGTGCWAYMYDFVKKVYDRTANNGVSFNKIEDIRSGDIIHYWYYNSVKKDNVQHWICVIKREGNKLYTAEGSYKGKVRISRTAYTIDTIRKKVNSYNTDCGKKKYPGARFQGWHYLSASLFTSQSSQTSSSSTDTSGTSVSSSGTSGSSSETSSTAKEASTMSISKALYPKGTKAKGSAFSILGVISSNYAIKKVTAKVTASDGSVKFSGTASPNAKSYNLNNLDSKMLFSSLANGTYRYVVSATDEMTTKTLVNVSFTVAASASVKGSSLTFPTTIQKGNGFGVYGTISSSSKLKKVQLFVYKADGTVVLNPSVAPNAKSYNIHKLDSKMTFAKLSAGKYLYQVVATDANGVQSYLVTKFFTVK